MKSEDDEGVFVVRRLCFSLSAVIKSSQTPGVALSLSAQSEEPEPLTDRTGLDWTANLRFRLKDVLAG